MMDDTLDLYLAQRNTLLADDSATLAQLKAHDRQLLSALDQGQLMLPLAARQVSDEDLFAALDDDLDAALLLVEARARLWPGELMRIQHRLVARAEDSRAAWWLAAHYATLPCPFLFPEQWDAQLWAARALQRRNRESMLPEPWREWALVMGGQRPIQPVVEALWAEGDGQPWESWLAPLLTLVDGKEASALVNWLANHLDDTDLIRVMGLSCQGRFLPWLANMRHNESLADAALREVRWLTGGQSNRFDGQQVWGEHLSQDVCAQLFRRLPLGFRGRLWHWCGGAVQGAATSLQGGEWCLGS
ncbi:MAG: hypothetical protein LAT63_17370 [Marinobacter sp.]|nr:hypothetical protein [Marinobacter sp.]